MTRFSSKSPVERDVKEKNQGITAAKTPDIIQFRLVSTSTGTNLSFKEILTWNAEFRSQLESVVLKPFAIENILSGLIVSLLQ